MLHNPREDVYIGQRVLYIDGYGQRHRAIVVDDVPGEDYVTLVRSANPRKELGEGYHSQVSTETSVYPHDLVAVEESESDSTIAYLPIRWKYDGEWETDEAE